jgi:hypothetical protein
MRLLEMRGLEQAPHIVAVLRVHVRVITIRRHPISVHVEIRLLRFGCKIVQSPGEQIHRTTPRPLA